MHICTLLLGSNEGDRTGILESALDAIGREAGKIKKVSSVYETEPWGFESEMWFLNLVAIVETRLHARGVLEVTGAIEKQLGRKRKNRSGYAPRTIDIDILFFDDRIINEPGLQIPHPKMHKRRFTLIPLTEIAPGYIHPVLEKSVAALTRQCTDKHKVIKYGTIQLNPTK